MNLSSVLAWRPWRKPQPAPAPAPVVTGPAEFDVDGVRLLAIERQAGSVSVFRYLVTEPDGRKAERQTAVTCSLEDHAKFLRRFQEKMARAEKRFQDQQGGRPC